MSLNKVDLEFLINKGTINRRTIVIHVHDPKGISFEDGESKDIVFKHLHVGKFNSNDNTYRELTGYVHPQRDTAYVFKHGNLIAEADTDTRLLYVFRIDRDHRFDDDGGYRLVAKVPADAYSIFFQKMNRSRRV